MNILIIGASGFLGKAIKEVLVENSQVNVYEIKRCLGMTCTHDYITTNLICVTESGELRKPIDLNFACVYILSTVYKRNSEDLDIVAECNICYLIKIVSELNHKFKTIVYTNSYLALDTPSRKFTSFYAHTKETFGKYLEQYIDTRKNVLHNVYLFDVLGKGDSRKKILDFVNENTKLGVFSNLSGGKQLISPILVNQAAQILADFKIMEFETGVYRWQLNGTEWMTLQEVVSIFEEIKKTKFLINWGVNPYLGDEVFEPVQIFPNLQFDIKIKSITEVLTEIYTQRQNHE